jgi:hypothetical protein
VKNLVKSIQNALCSIFWIRQFVDSILFKNMGLDVDENIRSFVKIRVSLLYPILKLPITTHLWTPKFATRFEQHHNINVKKLIALWASLPKILEATILSICISLYWSSIVPTKVFSMHISRMDAHKTSLEFHLPSLSTHQNGYCKDFKLGLGVVVVRLQHNVIFPFVSPCGKYEDACKRK